MVAEPVFDAAPPAFRGRQGAGRQPWRDRGVQKRRGFLKAAGAAGLAWFAFSLLGGEDEYMYRDEQGFLIREDRNGVYNLGPDPDGSKAEELGIPK